MLTLVDRRPHCRTVRTARFWIHDWNKPPFVYGTRLSRRYALLPVVILLFEFPEADVLHSMQVQYRKKNFRQDPADPDK